MPPILDVRQIRKGKKTPMLDDEMVRILLGQHARRETD